MPFLILLCWDLHQNRGYSSNSYLVYFLLGFKQCSDLPLDPLEALLLVLPAHDEAAAPGRVDVEPDAVLVADVCSIRVISRA